jgi:hypothetical protein
MITEDPRRDHQLLQPHHPRGDHLRAASPARGCVVRELLVQVEIEQQDVARIDLDARDAGGPFVGVDGAAILAVPVLGGLLAVGERRHHVHRERGFTEALRHDDGARPPLARRLLLQLLHRVVERVRGADDLVEEPREVLSRDLVDDLEEVLRPRMPETSSGRSRWPSPSASSASPDGVRACSIHSAVLA